MRNVDPVHRRFALGTMVALAALLCAACAKIGDPQPPVARVLRPATDLQASQSGQGVVLVATISTQYTNGATPSARTESAQLLRITEPDRAAAAPLPEQAFVEKAEVVATVQPQTLAGAKDGRVVIEDGLTFSDTSAPYSNGFRYALRFLNRKNETAGISNQVFVAPIPLPATPERPRAVLSQESIRLTWDVPTGNVDGSQPASVAGYNLYRADAPDAFRGAPLNPQPLPGPEFEDRAFEFDRTYYYKVSIVGRVKPWAETAASAATEVSARDTFPPGPPENLNAVVESGVVFLLWSAPPQNDVAGYRIYRSTAGAAPQQLESELIRELSYRDTKAAPSQTYSYTVRAIDTHGNEGSAAETSIGIR
jgi:hypothetical protein